jgi:hypothetical protein
MAAYMSSLRLACLVAVAACSSSSGNNSADSPQSQGSDGGIDTPVQQGSGFHIVRQFDGDSGPDLASCTSLGGHCDRPDGNLAADGTHVVQVTWQHVNVYDYSGQVTSSLTLSQLIANAGLVATTLQGNPPYEAHVVYDEFVGRWIITASCKYDCLLVSATSDPAGAWSGIYLANNGSDPSMHLGYDKNGVYISEIDPGVHDANTAGYSFADFAIPAAEIAWTGSFAPAHLNKSSGTPLDGQPAIDHDANKQPGDPAFFLCKTCPAGGCQNLTNNAFSWLLTTVTWSGTTASYSADQLVPSTVVYNAPLNAPQAGSTTTLRVVEDHRVLDAIQRGSHVYGVLGSGPQAGVDTNDLLFWVDLDCTTPSACTVASTGKVADAALHLFYPTIGVDAAGNVGVVAAASSATTDVSLYAYRHLATDPTGAMSAPLPIVAGSQPYTCTGGATQVSFANATGIATALDPSDGTRLWTMQQYGSSATPCQWGTRVVEYQLE